MKAEDLLNGKDFISDILMLIGYAHADGHYNKEAIDADKYSEIAVYLRDKYFLEDLNQLKNDYSILAEEYNKLKRK